MLTVYLLRHGQTAWNADNNRYCGLTDIALTDTGLQQAEKVRRQLQDVSFDAVYASPLQRAYATAQIIAGSTDVIIDQRLIEADFGEWEGKTKEEFIPLDPQSWALWNEDPMINRAGRTGDNAQTIITRVDDFFQSVQRLYPNGRILVVAHNAVNRFYLAHKLEMPARNYRRLFFDNSSISMFTLDADSSITLHQFNSILPFPGEKTGAGSFY